MLGLWGGPLNVSPPQIASLPAPKKEQLDLPEGPRLWGLSAYKVGSARLQRIEGGLEGAVFPQSPGCAHAGEVGGPVSVQGMRGEAGCMRSQEAGTWGSHWLPGLGCGGEVSGLLCVSETGDLCGPECCDQPTGT